MKKWLIVSFMVSMFIIGCQENNTNQRVQVRRSQVYVGMEEIDIWSLYGVNISDVNTYKFLPKTEHIEEYQEGRCDYKTDRYWLLDGNKKQPFLLTFQSCKLPNYEAVEAETQKRLEELHLSPTYPELRKEIDTASKKEKINSLAVEKMFVWNLKPPASMTNDKLIKISLCNSTNLNTNTTNSMRQKTQSSYSNQGGSLKPNAYGPGVHMNQYGQPVTLKPDFGGVPGERLQIQQNAYGPGVHMDQYGRPVREQRWP